LQKGRKWLIKESRVVSTQISDAACCVEYCGDPSILWGLYRLMYHKTPTHGLPRIKVMDRRGDVPYLRMLWDLRLQKEVERYLRNNDIVITDELWTH